MDRQIGYRIHSLRQMVRHHSHNVNLTDRETVTVRVNRPLWLIHTARDQDREREMMGFCIMLYTVPITQGEGQERVTIVFYCTHPGPSPVQCV